jgi:hypothetical protein
MTKLKLIKVQITDMSGAVPYEYQNIDEAVKLPNGTAMVYNIHGASWCLQPYQYKDLGEISSGASGGHSLHQLLGQDVKHLSVEFK